MVERFNWGGNLLAQSVVLSFRPSERCRHAAKGFVPARAAASTPSKETAAFEGGRLAKIGGGSAAPAPLGLRPSPIRWIAAAAAINTAALAIISAARTVPALTMSAVKAALVEAWAIPAVCVKADRDVLDRRAGFARQFSSYRRAQWRRFDTARHEPAYGPTRQDKGERL